MVLTFEWVSACPLLVLFSTQRSEWLQASHIYNKFFPPCFVLFYFRGMNSFFFFFVPGENFSSSAPLGPR